MGWQETCNSARLLLFPACIMSAINSKYYSKPYCYKLIQYVCVVLSKLVKRYGHVVCTSQNKILETLATVATTQRMIQKVNGFVQTVVTICTNSCNNLYEQL